MRLTYAQTFRPTTTGPESRLVRRTVKQALQRAVCVWTLVGCKGATGDDRPTERLTNVRVEMRLRRGEASSDRRRLEF
jgi:hypothetical protein